MVQIMGIYPGYIQCSDNLIHDLRSMKHTLAWCSLLQLPLTAMI